MHKLLWKQGPGRYLPVILLLSIVSLGLSEETAGAAPKKLNVALYGFCHEGLEQSTVNILVDRIGTELYKTDAFTVLDRGQINNILEEQEFQKSDCTSEECVMQVGQLLGVSHMITGVVGKIGNTYTISIRVVSITTGKIVWSDNTDCKNCKEEDVLTESTHIIAGKLASQFDPQNPGGHAEEDNGTSGHKRVWPWVLAGTAVVAGGAAAAIMLIPPGKTTEDRQVGPAIPLN